MMKKVSGVLLVLAAGISGLALVTSAAGTTARAPKSQRLHVPPLEALALDGYRVAYDVAWIKASRRPKRAGHPNRVFVWNLRTGKTINVSGKRGTGADSNNPRVSLTQLAIAGTRVAWLTQSRFASPKGEDDLYTSSVQRPKVRRVAQEVRNGDNCGKMIHGAAFCTGNFLGGLVGAGNQIVVNRWTLDWADGYSFFGITKGELDALNGERLKALATGGDTVEAVDTDQGRVAVSRDPEVYAEETVGLYSSTGAPLISVVPTGQPYHVALSGPNLVVFEGSKLALYDASSGLLRKTFILRGQPSTGDVQGNIAVYPTGRSVRALNLSNGKDRVVGRLPHRITVARIDSFGLVYANAGGPGYGYAKAFPGPIVFVPFRRVAAAVS